AVHQDTPYHFAAATFGFTDPNDTPPNHLLAVEITTLPTHGTLTDNSVAVTAGQFVSATDINAGLLVYTPNAPAPTGAGFDSVTFQGQDDGGTANGGIDTDQSANTLTVAIVGANQAPSGTDNTKTILEDHTYTFAAVDFGFSDADTPADHFQAVEITTLPGGGTLTDNNIAVTAGQFVSVADITGGKLVFTPTANANGTPETSFTFQVQDAWGSAKWGVGPAQASKPLHLNDNSTNTCPPGPD